MKQILKDRIINIDSEVTDKKFLIKKINWEKNITSNSEIEVIFLGDLLEKRKNVELLEKVKEKPAMWANVYSAKDELEIFRELFEDAIKNSKKIHIVGITLKEEVEILEEYYKSLGFWSEDINCFECDFSIPLVTASVKIENLMWRGSDYKRMGKEIFFNPPIRESGEVKAMFKGVNRGVTAGIFIDDFNKERKIFLTEEVLSEHIPVMLLAKVLSFNMIDIGLVGEEKDFVIEY